MFFVVKHSHDYSTCQAHNPESVAAMGDLVTRASDHGITVHGRYGNRLEHTNFYILEASSMEDIDALFDPVLEMGNWDITPVVKK
ncbi:DUF3303 domain-containing protein [Alphaproteobacteria bacterium]|jgi:hypothetical protein|nr:DUF3303 domain-containing protein [Alphaproteobacteria bacterium]MDG1415976.1 DUF3303 domain-containing protein [Alphaproteobacteria bacterium]